MLKQTHTAFGLCTALYIMASLNDISTSQALWGSAAVLVSAPLADCDLLDNKADNLYAELCDTVKHCFLPFGIYFYYHVLVAKEPIYSFRGTDLYRMVIQMLLWFVLLHFTVVSPHRGWSHSFVWMAVFTALWRWMIPDDISWRFFMLGYASHLWIDLLNKIGEPLLFPIQWRPCMKLCKSDGLVNNAILGLSAVMYAYMMFMIQSGTWFKEINLNAKEIVLWLDSLLECL